MIIDDDDEDEDDEEEDEKEHRVVKKNENPLLLGGGKKWVAEYHTKENHTEHMLHEFTTNLSALLQARIRIHRPT